MIRSTERKLKNGQISRDYYEQGVIVVYDEVDSGSVVVTLLSSQEKGKGNARRVFTVFTNQFRDKDIYVKISSEFGADLTKLIKFYQSIGYKKVKHPEKKDFLPSLSGDAVIYVKKGRHE